MRDSTCGHALENFANQADKAISAMRWVSAQAEAWHKTQDELCDDVLGTGMRLWSLDEVTEKEELNRVRDLVKLHNASRSSRVPWTMSDFGYVLWLTWYR